MAFSRTWDATYEASPPDTQAAKLLGLRIREYKVDVRERFNVEHDMPGTGAGKLRHKFPQGDAAAQAVVEGEFVAGSVFFRTDINCIRLVKSTGPIVYQDYYGAFLREIRMYGGTQASIPAGWVLCDGTIQNGIQTPNLKGKFIVGTDPGGDADYDTTDPIGTPKTGGAKTHTLAAANIPQITSGAGSAHMHLVSGMTLPSAPGGSFVGYEAHKQASEGGSLNRHYTSTESAHTHTVGSASPTAVDHRPTYYALAYIIYVGLS